MRVELLCTGNELLDGSVIDSNSAWLEARLFELGIEVTEKRVVPDHLPTIAAAIREIAARADFLVTSGGLGPTPDDLTAEALAQAAGVSMVENAGVRAAIEAKLAERNRVYSEAQARQAHVPSGAEVLPNRFGTAPHIQMKLGHCQVMLLPGVPREFYGLAEAFVLPRIGAALSADPTAAHYAFLEVRCYGVWEADMVWAVRELPDRFPGLRVGTRTAAPENHLKIRASAKTQAEAEAMREAARAVIRERLGDRIFTEDSRPLPQVVFEALRDRAATVAFAESCTGGMAAALLTDWPGASEVLRAGWVVYTEEAKQRLLGVSAQLIAQHGVVSEEVAVALAERARDRADTTYGGAVTGWAGPGGGDAKNPVGTVFVALASSSGATVVERLSFPGVERDRVRRGAAYALLNQLRLAAGGS
jgi:nicotinamide-nucleotide amidase